MTVDLFLSDFLQTFCVACCWRLRERKHRHNKVISIEVRVGYGMLKVSLCANNFVTLI